MNHLCWMQSLKNCLEPLNGHGSSSLGKTCVWPIGFCILSVQLIGPFRQHFQNWYVYIVNRLYTSQVSDIMSHKKEKEQQVWNIEYQKPNWKISYMIYIIHHIIHKYLFKTCEQKYRSTICFDIQKGQDLKQWKKHPPESWLNPHPTRSNSGSLLWRFKLPHLDQGSQKNNRIRCVLFTMRMKKDYF